MALSPGLGPIAVLVSHFLIIVTVFPAEFGRLGSLG